MAKMTQEEAKTIVQMVHDTWAFMRIAHREGMHWDGKSECIDFEKHYQEEAQRVFEYAVLLVKSEEERKRFFG